MKVEVREGEVAPTVSATIGADHSLCYNTSCAVLREGDQILHLPEDASSRDM